MATSFRIRPNTRENKLDVVKLATFTNPQTHVPDSAVAVVMGNTVPGHSHIQKMLRMRQCIDAVRENDGTPITASQYMKVTVPYIGSSKGDVVVSEVTGLDTAAEGNITIYVGSQAGMLGQSQYLDTAFNYLRDYILEDSKAA